MNKVVCVKKVCLLFVFLFVGIGFAGTNCKVVELCTENNERIWFKTDDSSVPFVYVTVGEVGSVSMERIFNTLLVAKIHNRSVYFNTKSGTQQHHGNKYLDGSWIILK